MGTITQRTVQDRALGIVRQINALSRGLIDWDSDDLVVLSTMEAAISELRGRVIYGLREQGVTDKQIGEVLGMTRQAVSKRWPGGGRYVGAAGRYRKPTIDQEAQQPC
jgi:hypothetical protein